MVEVAQRRSDHLKLLTDAMVYRLEGKCVLSINQSINQSEKKRYRVRIW